MRNRQRPSLGFSDKSSPAIGRFPVGSDWGQHLDPLPRRAHRDCLQGGRSSRIDPSRLHVAPRGKDIRPKVLNAHEAGCQVPWRALTRVVQCCHFCPFRQQCLHEVGTREAGASGYNDIHSRRLHDSILLPLSAERVVCFTGSHPACLDRSLGPWA